MQSPGDAWVAGATLLAAGAVLAAPVLGRVGAPGWANVAMGVAAASGVAAFAMAATATFRAARGAGRGAARRSVTDAHPHTTEEER